MSRVVLHSGPPPSVGWWPVAFRQSSEGIYLVSWWDSRYWSVAINESTPKFDIGYWASLKITHPSGLFWAHRPESWPARSRT